MYSTHSSSNCFNAWQLASTNVVYVFTRLLIQKDSYGMRERRLIEYFKQCFPSDISLTTNKELAYGLTSLPPYEVSISDVMVIHLHCQVFWLHNSFFFLSNYKLRLELCMWDLKSRSLYALNGNKNPLTLIILSLFRYLLVRYGIV